MRCNARFQLSAVMPARDSTSSSAVAIAISAVALVVAAGGAGLFLLSDSDQETEPAPPAVVVVEPPEPAPVPQVPEPEPEPEPAPEPETPAVVDAPAEVVEPAPTGNRPDPDARYDIRTDGAHFRGPEDAPVTIVLFTDFECPFCRRINETLDEVERRYEGKIRFAYMHNPLGFHPGAMPAAKAAVAADAQGKFWEMYEKLFENREALKPEDIRGYAKELQLDMDRFDEAMKDRATERRIEAHQAEAKRLKARGTPTSFVNGRFLPGAQPIDAFAKIIDEELDAG